MQLRRAGKTATPLLLVGVLATGCVPGIDFANEPRGEVKLGKSLFQLLWDNLAQSPRCAEQKLAVLNQHRTALINAIDTTIDRETLGLLRSGVGAMVPATKNGVLPAMTTDLAEIIEMLVQDPEQRALGGIVDLASTRGVLDLDSWITLGGRLLEQQRVEAFLAATAAVIRGSEAKGENDDLVGEFVTTISSWLRAVDPTETDLWADLRDLGLAPAAVDPTVVGHPAWSVRADARGNPEVAVDPKTGKLFDPFIDRDGDGIADVNASGSPIDDRGQPIDLPAFGRKGQRDAEFRALHDSGWYIYHYFDVKRTGVGLGLALAGDLFREGVHLDALPALQGALGPRQGYGPSAAFLADNPLADTAHHVVDVLALPSIPRLLNSWGDLVRTRGQLAERLVVALGKAISIFYDSGGSMAVPKNVRLVRNMLPLAANLLDQPGGKQQTLRQLLETLRALGKVAPESLARIGDTMRFRSISKGEACSDAPIDEDRSDPVDYTKGRYDNGDNRSVFEQNIELMAAADECKVPLVGKTISELIVDTLADESPGTVCNIIDKALGLAKIPGSKWVAIPALSAIGCDGSKIWSTLESLKSLAKSGALDAYLPIANLFKKNGRTRQLIALFHVLREDLVRGNSGSSALRELEPALIAALSDDVGAPIFDLVDALFLMKVDSTTTGADAFAELIADLLEPRRLEARDGTTATGTLAAAVVDAWLRVVTRIEASQHRGAMDRLLRHFLDLIARTTPGPDGTLQLANRKVIPFAERMLVFAGKMLDMSTSDREAFVQQRQRELTDFLTSGQLANMIELWHLVHTSPAQLEFDRAAATLLTPSSDPQQDVFGGLLRVVGGVLQTDYQPSSLRSTMQFLADVLDPSQGRAQNLITGLDEILRRDEADSFIKLLQNLLSQGEDGTSEAPLSVFASVAGGLGTIDDATCRPDPRPEARVALAASALRALVAFMRDDRHGLGAVYRLIEASPAP